MNNNSDDNKSIYAIAGIHIGWFRNAELRIRKLWYMFGLKSRVGCLSEMIRVCLLIFWC